MAFLPGIFNKMAAQSSTISSFLEGENSKEKSIRDVWEHNLEDEFKMMREVVQEYPYIAMDTEFPGIVIRPPTGEYKSSNDYQYQLLKCNVNRLKLIQVGFTFLNSRGQLPPNYNTWQFHFKFCLDEEMYAEDSINLLLRSGIQFMLHEKDGIRVEDFGELLMTSGLVTTDKVTWLSFHSGYDFGYLMRTMLLKNLPENEENFSELLNLLFPVIYDIKILLRHPLLRNANLKGGLQELADQLEVERVGPQHQAGSDSLLTGMTFFRLKEVFFEACWDQISHEVVNQLCGLNGVFAAPYYIPGLDSVCSRNTSSVALNKMDRQSPTRLSPETVSTSTQDSADFISDNIGLQIGAVGEQPRYNSPTPPEQESPASSQ